MQLIKQTITDDYRIEIYLHGKSNHKYWSHKIIQRIILSPKDGEPYGSETRFHANVEKNPYDGKWEIEKGMQYLDRPIEIN